MQMTETPSILEHKAVPCISVGISSALSRHWVHVQRASVLLVALAMTGWRNSLCTWICGMDTISKPPSPFEARRAVAALGLESAARSREVITVASDAEVTSIEEETTTLPVVHVVVTALTSMPALEATAARTVLVNAYVHSSPATVMSTLTV